MNDTLTIPTRATGSTNGFERRLGGTVYDVHHQWKNRPADEAVYSVEELLARTGAARRESQEINDVAWDKIRVEVDERDALVLSRGRGAALITNHALQQICHLPGEGGAIAPVDFITSLSPRIAASALNDRLMGGVGRSNDAKLLVQQRGESLALRAITTTRYERVWDHDLALRLAGLCERGTWQPAEAFRRAGEASVVHAKGESFRLPLGWVGDRSMFVCLVDYEGVVEHRGNTYARFLLLSNSEVGSGALKVVFGLMDFACCNFILWGCTEVYEASLRHTKSVHERWSDLGAYVGKSLSADNRATIVEGMDRARTIRLGANKADVIEVAQNVTDLPEVLITDAYERAEATPRYGDPRTIWGMVNGITEASQHFTEHAAARTTIDAKAARLMRLLQG